MAYKKKYYRRHPWYICTLQKDFGTIYVKCTKNGNCKNCHYAKEHEKYIRSTYNKKTGV